MPTWTDRYWNSVDGLKLHYRDYAGPRDAPPILCIPGLTRNARDFEPVAERFAGEWRILCVDLRGRGESEYDSDSRRYSPSVYVPDILKLLDQEGIADAVFIGTSLGGLCTMLLASTDSDRIAGALLNDIGPEIDPAGIERIGGYVGTDTRFESWSDAATRLAERNREVFPNWGEGEWMRFVHRVCRATPDGIRFDYDMAIADNFRAVADVPPVDSWPYFRSLAGRPVTILRGGLSDLLASDVADRMAASLEDVELVTIPDVGHTPSFEEAESLAAVERLLDRVTARQKREAEA
jgi:pimeloyl-ACP methyl ester carboxylesterase